MSELGQKIIAEVRRIASENPDFRYVAPDDESGSCVYVNEGEPSCLIGQALWSLGLIDSGLEDKTVTVRTVTANRGSHYRVEHVNQDAAAIALSRLGIEVDSEESVWLSDVQLLQDLGKTWSSAAGVPV